MFWTLPPLLRIVEVISSPLVTSSRTVWPITSETSL